MDRVTALPSIHSRSDNWRIWLLSALALGLIGNAQALGLGRPQAHSLLGQPLVLSFPLSLRNGESLSMDCVSAEVSVGGAKLPANKVGVRLEGESETSLRAIRVLSSVPIEEPIVNVSLSLGCPTRLTRQFSAFMDPPTVQGSTSPDAHSNPESPRVLSPALRAALATADAKPKDLMGTNLSDAVGQERVTASKSPVGSGKLEDKARSKRVSQQEGNASRSASSSTVELNSVAAKPAKSDINAGAPKAPKALIASSLAAEPQLRMEAFDLNSIAAANSAAAAAASAAEAAMARLQTVESGLLGLKSEYQSNARKLSAMQQGIAADSAPATHQATPALTWGLGGLSLFLGLGVVFLWRGRVRQQAGLHNDWWGPALKVDAVETAENAKPAEPALSRLNAAPAEPQSDDEVRLKFDAKANTRAGESEPTLPRGALPEEHTMALPHSVGGEFAPLPSAMTSKLPDKESSGLARIAQLMSGDLSSEPLSVQFIDPSGSVAPAASEQNLVSVEELIDLEQQVDFFLVLGQDEAALDLLHAQLKQDQGGASGSALPYLKLMEICQQRSDALAFADIAGRYAVEFKVSPPAWDANLEQGPGLEGFPEVIRSLQARWSDSGASMVALQKLLSSKDGRSASFDLPALRDLLLLYSVARDRSEHEVRGEEIDLFLPLETDFGAGHPTGFDLMATMVWQGKPVAGAGGDAAPVDVDILLDDSGSNTAHGGTSKL